MSSAIIKMKRGSETDLAEVSKSILDDFKGDVAELSLEQMSEVNGVKVLLLILERYYMRNGSMAVSTVQITPEKSSRRRSSAPEAARAL